jgi:hypothetical protein
VVRKLAWIGILANKLTVSIPTVLDEDRNTATHLTDNPLHIPEIQFWAIFGVGNKEMIFLEKVAVKIARPQLGVGHYLIDSGITRNILVVPILNAKGFCDAIVGYIS